MKVKITDIKYDTDGQKILLPKQLVFNVSSDFTEEELADLISDETGFCVFNYRYQII